MQLSIPLSLYIHIPWCVRKCPYCDFNSHENKDNFKEELYVKALLLDLDEQLPKIQNRPLVSIFFGGGTPSLFSPESIANILQGVQQRLTFDNNIEITLEANPGTVDEARFKGFRDAGVNRLSLGLQSLQDEKLKALGRIHNREYALRAIQSAKNAGFKNFNLDIMHGLPNQSVEDAMQDLKDALQFNPPHFSWYQLTIEPNTFFHYQPPVLPVDDILFDIQEEGKKIIAEYGLKQYEVSAYAKEHQRCKHNVNYWEFGDYLGIGAGAHSKLTDASGTIHRHWQVKNPKDYLDPTKSFTASTSTLTQKDIIFEFMLNALRLNDGVSFELFTARTALHKDNLDSILSKAKSKKLLTDVADYLQPTPHGQRFLNDLTSMFL
jgi:putative oxygen-independent coproporphyrinogen III oxidase